MKINFNKVPPRVPDSDKILYNSNLCKSNHLASINITEMISMYNYIRNCRDELKYDVDMKRLVYILKKIGIEEV